MGYICMYVCMCQLLSGCYCYYDYYYTWRLVSNFIWLRWWKYFFKAFFGTIWLQEMGSEQIMEANIMPCDSCANFLVVFVQDEQPDVQGLAVTLVSGRSTTESAVGMNFCTFLCFSCQFLVVAFFFFFFPGRRGQNPSSNSPEKRLRYIDWVIILKGF